MKKWDNRTRRMVAKFNERPRKSDPRGSDKYTHYIDCSVKARSKAISKLGQIQMTNESVQIELDPYTGRRIQGAFNDITTGTTGVQSLTSGIDFDWDVQRSDPWLQERYRMHKITEQVASGGLDCNIPEDWVTVRVYDMNDCELDPEKLKTKARMITKLVKEGFKVFVQCGAGMNRSNCNAINGLVNLNLVKKLQKLSIEERWMRWYRVAKKACPCLWITSEIQYTSIIALKELEKEKQ